jgi:hypothetical protein
MDIDAGKVLVQPDTPYAQLYEDRGGCLSQPLPELQDLRAWRLNQASCWTDWSSSSTPAPSPSSTAP